ncbi:MAG TPA: hypothetical protein VFW97_16945 [Acidimicrobiia bacterium]|nr:hypothetical protein [Acidimicrobiia bacterium]
MLTWAGKGWMARIGDRGRALDVVRAHIAAEVDTRTDVIMSTVSADPWFPLPDRRPTGLVLEVVEGTADVTSYYSQRSDGYVVLASNQLKQVAADWYVFNESAATLRQTGAIGSVPPGDAEFVVQSAVLFPTAADGIRGEIALTRHPFDEVITGRVPTPTAPTGPLAYLPVAELEHATLLDRLLDGLRAGDVSALVTADHQLAVRVDGAGAATRFVDHDGADAADALVTLFAGARDITVVGRVTTEWYVFAEYLAVFDDEQLRRLVAIHPVRDGKFEGTFGYGIDVP